MNEYFTRADHLTAVSWSSLATAHILLHSSVDLNALFFYPVLTDDSRFSA